MNEPKTLIELIELIGGFFDDPPYSDTVEVCVGHYEDGEWIPEISLKDKDSAYGYLFDKAAYGHEVVEVEYGDSRHGHPLVFVTFNG